MGLTCRRLRSRMVLGQWFTNKPHTSSPWWASKLESPPSLLYFDFKGRPLKASVKCARQAWTFCFSIWNAPDTTEFTIVATPSWFSWRIFKNTDMDSRVIRAIMMMFFISYLAWRIIANHVTVKIWYKIKTNNLRKHHRSYAILKYWYKHTPSFGQYIKYFLLYLIITWSYMIRQVK